VAYHDTTTANEGGALRTTTGVDLESLSGSQGGYGVGYVVAGEWLQYSVNVAAAGTYTLRARVASSSAGGTFQVNVVGSQTTSGAITIPSTGTWSTWTTVTAQITLAAGNQQLRVVFNTPGASGYVGNLDSIEFASGGTSNPATVSLSTNGTSFASGVSVTMSATTGGSGTVSNVQFYDGSTLLNSDTTSPYSFSTTSLAVGSHSLTARSMNGSSTLATSSAVTVTINGSGGGGGGGGTRIQSSNLVYDGSFRVPGGIQAGGSANAGFEYGGTSLAYNPGRNSLFMVGHDWDQYIGEISIPSIGGTATALQNPRNALEGRLGSINPSDPNSKKVGGLLVANNRLIVSAYSYYDGNSSQVLSHFSRPLDLSVTGQLTGPVRVGSLGAGFYSGYMAPVPSNLQSALGNDALTGNCCLGIISRTSYGPGVFSFNSSSLSGATPLAYYPEAHPELGQWGAASQYFGGSDQVTGVVIPNGGQSVLFFGRHGTTFCYGTGDECNDPADNSKGVHGYPYQAYVWAFAVSDLAAVRAGSKQPWEVRPYAVWHLTQLGGSRVGGAAYDPATSKLYVSQMGGNGPLPVIHVYTIR
jgi:hypothetical protein